MSASRSSHMQYVKQPPGTNMGITKVTRLEKKNETDIKSFSWSLKPLFVWLNCIVIDLNYSADNRIQLLDNYKSILFTIIGFLLFSINLASQILSVYFQYEQPQSNSLTLLTNRIIDAINYGVRNIGVHASLLCVVYFHWKKLWKSAKKIEIFISHSSQIYVRLKILSVAGLFYILLMVITL